MRARARLRLAASEARRRWRSRLPCGLPRGSSGSAVASCWLWAVVTMWLITWVAGVVGQVSGLAQDRASQAEKRAPVSGCAGQRRLGMKVA